MHRPAPIGPPPVARVASNSSAPRPNRRNSAARPVYTVLLNLHVQLKQAYIAKDVSPSDSKLFVLFRRNSKEVASQAVPWTAGQEATWDQELNIQTSLLRNRRPRSNSLTTQGESQNFLKKDYEILVVALPSETAVALFSIDFAELVNQAPAPLGNSNGGHKSFQITPDKCRDRDAMLEFDIEWTYTSSTGNGQAENSSTGRSFSNAPPAAQISAQTPSSLAQKRSDNNSSMVSSRRGAPSVASSSTRGSEHTAVDMCNHCKTSKRRLERRDTQILQLETFLKESQKRIDGILVENEELAQRERCETELAAKHRTLTLRALQELEVAAQFLLSRDDEEEAMQPYIGLVQRLKPLYEEIGYDNTREDEALESINFDQERDEALERNRVLRERLELLIYSFGKTPKESRESGMEDGEDYDNEPSAPIVDFTMQMNALERENFSLKSKLDSAQITLKHYQTGSGPTNFSTKAASEVSETLSSSSQGQQSNMGEVEQLKSEKESLQKQLQKANEELSEIKSKGESNAVAPGFLNKIYMDVGKAKSALEDKVKELTRQLQLANEENAKLQSRLQHEKDDVSDGEDLQARLQEAESLAEERRKQLEEKEKEVDAMMDELSNKQQDLAVLGMEKRELQLEMDSVLRTQLKAQDQASEMEDKLEKLQKQVKETPQEKEAPANLSISSTPSQTNSNRNGSRDEELEDMKKQLKLAKQEVMQLRYRSNQLESVHERLETALKEKRSLEAKLTALEGQLYEQRSRTISEQSFIPDAHRDTAGLAELRRQLDEKKMQLEAAEKEVERLQSSSGSDDEFNDLVAKVRRFEEEIMTLTSRNEHQAERLEALSEEVNVVKQDRGELEKIVQQMQQEIDRLSVDGPMDYHSSEDGYAQEEPPSFISSVAAPSPPMTGDDEEKPPPPPFSIDTSFTLPNADDYGDMDSPTAATVASVDSGPTSPAQNSNKLAQFLSHNGPNGSQATETPGNSRSQRSSRVSDMIRKYSNQ